MTPSVSEIDHEDTPNAVCPKCGYEDHDSWELHLEGDGDSAEVDCPRCEEPYRVTMCLTVTYSTEAIEETPHDRNQT